MAKKTNKKKNRIIIIAVIVIIAGLFIYSTISNNIKEQAAMNVIDMNSTTVIESGDMSDSISGSGIVQSEEITAITTTLTAEVLTVNVEVGDYVEEGDVLATLDSEAIDDQVALTRASNSTTIKSSELGYEETLAALEKAIEDGQDLNDEIWPQLNDASIAADLAEANVTALNNAMASYLVWEAETDPISKATLKAALDAQLTALNLATDITKEELQAEVMTANTEAELAKATHETLAAQLATNNSVRFAAQDTYDQVTGKKAVTSSDAKQILIQKEQLDNTKASLNNSLDALLEQQDGAVITASTSGTITSVGLSVGQYPTGIAFTIQDLDSLSISSSVKEREFLNVEEGMKIIVTTNSIKDVTYHGTLDMLAPTGTMSATGDTVFETKILIDDEDGLLRPGMNVKVKYVLFEKEGVIQVPYDSIYTDNDQDYVLVAKELSNGKYQLVPTEVTRGSVNDIKIEVTGLEINDRIINYPVNYLDRLDEEYEISEGSLNG